MSVETRETAAVAFKTLMNYRDEASRKRMNGDAKVYGNGTDYECHADDGEFLRYMEEQGVSFFYVHPADKGLPDYGLENGVIWFHNDMSDDEIYSNVGPTPKFEKQLERTFRACLRESSRDEFVQIAREFIEKWESGGIDIFVYAEYASHFLRRLNDQGGCIPLEAIDLIGHINMQMNWEGDNLAMIVYGRLRELLYDEDEL